MRWPGYSEYKESGVEWLGEVPEHWEQKRLKFGFPRLYSGVSVNAENIPADDDSIGVMKTSCVYGNRFTATENKRVFDDEIERVACPVTADSLIVSRMNTPELVGNCGYVERDHPNLYLPDRLWIARFREFQPVHGKFAWYFCISDGISKLTGALATGTSGSMKNLSQEAFLNIDAILPPFNEQTAIANFLDRETGRIDTLVAKKRRLIALLKEKRTALISRTVTRGLPEDAAREFGLEPHTRFKDSGIEWLGEVPEGWIVKQIRFDNQVGNGSTPARDNGLYWEEGEIPWLNSSVVNKEKVIEADQYVTAVALHECHLPMIKPPAVLVGITGQGKTRGMATTLLIEATINQHIAFIKPRRDSLDVEYARRIFDMAYHFLRSESDGGGSTKGAITCEQLKALKIPHPPIDEQTAIANYLECEIFKIDQLVEKVEAAITRLQEYRTALITAAVTGKIDVREAAA